MLDILRKTGKGSRPFPFFCVRHFATLLRHFLFLRITPITLPFSYLAKVYDTSTLKLPKHLVIAIKSPCDLYQIADGCLFLKSLPFISSPLVDMHLG